MARRAECRARSGGLLAACILCLPVQAQPALVGEALDFGFIDSPPGIRIALDSHRLHVDCTGNGQVTVLFEPGLGGSAFEWYPVRELLDERVTACVYDRAGYAWSDPSPFARDALQIAREADQLLQRLDVEGPLILVGHSFGGFVMRHLARLRERQMIGLILVDASHEDQFERMRASGAPPVVPKGRHFVIAAATVPDNLPMPLRRKVAAFARMRKSYVATHGELASFRRSAEQLKAVRGTLDFPVCVLRRGRDLYRQPSPRGGKMGGMQHSLWVALQEDLARLSPTGHVIVATTSGHHVHVDEPELVAQTVEGLLHAHENRCTGGAAGHRQRPAR